MDDTLALIDQYCARLREALNSGKPSPIEALLKEAPEALRDQLLAELVTEEAEIRIGRGDVPQWQEYAERFPDRINAASQGFERFQLNESPTVEDAGDSTARKPTRAQIGPYKLLQQIGEGGMGTVWMAEQLEPVRRRVALKVIKPGMDSEQVIARFEAERQALAMMDHQNIAKVHDGGMTEDGRPYFAMELVQGVPFTQYCDDNKLSLNERLELFIPVCRAVQHAHQKGIIHRDLKPSNVLVTLYDGKPVPKVIDFGLAKALQLQQRLTDRTVFTEFGQVVGTVQYMSPEQAEMNALDVDTRTDIYSLGVMLYEVLTGSTPLEKEKLAEKALLQLLAAIKETDPPRPSARLSNSGEAINGISAQRRITPGKLQQVLRGELDWVVMKALEKDRTRRYETAAGFAEDLERYIGNEAVIARPPSIGYRTRKFVRKNQAIVAPASAIAVLLVSAVGVSSWFALDANHARVEVSNEKTKVERQRDRADEQAKLASARASDLDLVKEDLEANLARTNYYLAVARWNAHRARDANVLLDKVPEQHRHFEWHFAKRQFQGSDLTCYGHSDHVNAITVSPDGKLVASGSADASIRIWDMSSGELLQTLDEHVGSITSLSFSPDGKWIASANDLTIKIWDAATGDVRQTISQERGSIHSVSVCADNTRVVSADDNGMVKIWDATSGNELLGFEISFSLLKNTATLSPDGKWILALSRDHKCTLWDIDSGQVMRSLLGASGRISSATFSPDGRIAAIVGDLDQSVRLWAVDTGEELPVLSYSSYFPFVSAVSFSPDGRWMAAAGDNVIAIWDVITRDVIQILAGHTAPVTSISFSPDGRRVISGSEDSTVKIWETNSAQGQRTLESSPYPISNVAFSPDSRRIVIGDEFWFPTRVVEVATGEVHCTLDGGGAASVRFSHDARLIAAVTVGGQSIAISDANSGELLRKLDVPVSKVNCIDISSNGKWIASGSSNGTISVWDTNSGQEVLSINENISSVKSVSFSPNGNLILSGSQNGLVDIWDASTGNWLRTIPTSDGSNSTCAIFSPDGSRILTYGPGSSMRSWNADNCEPLCTFLGHQSTITSASYSADGMRIASGSRDNSIKIWDANTGEELRSLEGHRGAVFCVDFSPDGTRIVSCGADAKIRIWDGNRATEQTTLRGHTLDVRSASFGVEGKRIYSSSARPANNTRQGGIPITELRQEERLVWDAKTGAQLEGARWPTQLSGNQGSPDGRYFVAPSGNDVLLVDLLYKHLPSERTFRESKARINTHWHREQAEQAAATEDWYGETFHRAWIIKGSPDDQDAIPQFNTAYDKLAEKYRHEAKDLAPYLPSVVREMRQRYAMDPNDQVDQVH